MTELSLVGLVKVLSDINTTLGKICEKITKSPVKSKQPIIQVNYGEWVIDVDGMWGSGTNWKKNRIPCQDQQL